MKKLLLLTTLLFATACQPQSVVNGNQNTNIATTTEAVDTSAGEYKMPNSLSTNDASESKINSITSDLDQTKKRQSDVFIPTTPNSIEFKSEKVADESKISIPQTEFTTEKIEFSVGGGGAGSAVGDGNQSFEDP